MFIIGNFVQAFAVIADKLCELYSWVVLIAILLQWVSPDPFNPVVKFFHLVTDPVFGWVRRRLPFAIVGMLDLSPTLVLLALWFLRMFLVKSLMDLAFRLR